MTSWDGPIPLRPRTLPELLDDLDRACDELERAARELGEVSPLGVVLLSVMEKPSRTLSREESAPGSDEGRVNGDQDESSCASGR